jgi:hypothetical protein
MSPAELLEAVEAARAEDAPLDEWASEARAQAVEAWEDVRELIQKHPAKAVVCAFMLGAGYGLLFIPRRAR